MEYTYNNKKDYIPIQIENRPNEKRLWIVDVLYDDTTTSLLTDSLLLTLNSAHKDFGLVDPESKCFCEKYVDEIVCNAIAYLLYQLKEDGYLDNNVESGDVENSVIQYALYCKNSMDIDFSTPNSIMDSLRIFSEGRNKDGV